MSKRNPERKSEPLKKEERSYFIRLFERYGFKTEEKFVVFFKRLFYVMFCSITALFLMQKIADFARGGSGFRFMSSLIASFFLLLAFYLNIFLLKERKLRLVFYGLSGIAVGAILVFNNTTTAIALYILVLTALYMDAGKVKPRVLLLCLGIPVYFLCFVAHIHFLVGGIIDLFPVIRQSLGAIVAIVLHFIVLHLCVAFYRQYMRLDKALKELDASKKELEKAYEAVAEVTVLEERQRIAKDIHDTAGHSITTVIMQTEAAKRILEQDPKEAKQKIVAANLQAKHALDELRDSVHLLSGHSANQTLRSALEDILHESTDGTEIVIRSNVEDIAVSSAKQRFLCNSLKEGISNGLRHGKATAFWFELKEEDGRVYFLLSDNGKGVEKNLKEGFGLSSMRSHAKTLGGEVTFESEEDEGFELKIVL